MTLIEMLRANGSWEADAAVTAIQVRDSRIEKLESALFDLAEAVNASVDLKNLPGGVTFVKRLVIARKALEGKDD